MRYGQKVFDMVKGIDIEFGKKKEKDGTTTRKKKKRDKMEEPPVASVPFKKQSCFFKYLSNENGCNICLSSIFYFICVFISEIQIQI